jgi:hypothetical protein
MRSWVGPRTSLDDVEKEKILHLLGLESDDSSMKQYKMTTGRENQSTWRKTFPRATSTINVIWNGSWIEPRPPQ